jgi:hypothetical protein
MLRVLTPDGPRKIRFSTGSSTQNERAETAAAMVGQRRAEYDRDWNGDENISGLAQWETTAEPGAAGPGAADRSPHAGAEAVDVYVLQVERAAAGLAAAAEAAAVVPRSIAFMLTRKNRNAGEPGSCPDGMKQFIARAAEGLDPAGSAAARKVDARAPLGSKALKALQRMLKGMEEPTLEDREAVGIAAGADDRHGAGAAVAAGGGGDLGEPWVVGQWRTDVSATSPWRCARVYACCALCSARRSRCR